MFSTHVRVSILTALDQAQIPTTRVSDGCFQIQCPACSSKAWAYRAHIQCQNSRCTAQTFSSEDILALAAGDYQKAAEKFQELSHFDPAAEERRRAVLDTWLTVVMSSERSAKVVTTEAAWERQGFHTADNFLNTSWVTRGGLKSLVELGHATGASMAVPLLKEELPEAAWVVTFMTCPTEIAMMLVYAKNPLRYRPMVIRWRPARLSFSGLLGLRDNLQLYMTPGIAAASDVAKLLNQAGHQQPLAILMRDSSAVDVIPSSWSPEDGQFVAVTNSDDDYLVFSDLLRRRPEWQDTLKASMRKELPELRVGRRSREFDTFSILRITYLALSIREHRIIPMEASRLLEQMSLTPAEIRMLVGYFQGQGRFELVDQLQRAGRRRVIEETERLVVRETVDAYTCETSVAQSIIANFALELEESVNFQERQDTWAYGKVRFGGDTVPVVLSSQSLHNPQMLQDAVRGCLIRHGRPDGYQNSPTVVDSKRMRDFVLPYLRNQVSKIPFIEGTCRLGWEPDRSSFRVPGFEFNENGVSRRKTRLHPDVATLALYRTVDDWYTADFPDLADHDRDFLAMLTASIVRSFSRMPALPIFLRQSPQAAAYLNEVCRATGQRMLHEFSGQQRSPILQMAGVHGYPLAAVGVAAPMATASGLPCVLLVDQGLEFPADLDISDERVRRSVQACIHHVTAWCLSGAASRFQVLQAVDATKQLRKEGSIVLEHITGKPWPVSGVEFAAFEALLARLSIAQVSECLTLENGTSLVFDLTTVSDHPTAEILEELAGVGCKEEPGHKLRMSAASVLPMIERYYGRTPELNVAV